MAAIGSIESKHDTSDAQDEYLSSCEQLQSEAKNERPDAVFCWGQLRYGCGHFLQSKVRNEMETAAFEFVPEQMQNALREL